MLRKKTKNTSFILYTIFCIHIASLTAFADIYKYIDSSGVLHFTNIPVSNHYQLFIKGRPDKKLKKSASGRYDKYISAASRRYRISFPLLKAMIKVESDFNPRAVSKAGAKGLMQIMPKNYPALNINDPFNPRENIYGGTRYIKDLLSRYKGKLPLALAAYNAGPSAVDKYKKIPPYPETQNYVKNVMRYYYTFKK